MKITNEDNMKLMARYPDNYFDLTACELDKEYYDKAMKRINQHKQQIRMF
jgi:hypothetical protein